MILTCASDEYQVGSMMTSSDHLQYPCYCLSDDLTSFRPSINNEGGSLAGSKLVLLLLLDLLLPSGSQHAAHQTVPIDDNQQRGAIKSGASQSPQLKGH